MRLGKVERRKGGQEDYKAFYEIIFIAVNAGKLVLIYFRLNSSLQPTWLQLFAVHGRQSHKCVRSRAGVCKLWPASQILPIPAFL